MEMRVVSSSGSTSYSCINAGGECQHRNQRRRYSLKEVNHEEKSGPPERKRGYEAVVLRSSCDERADVSKDWKGEKGGCGLGERERR